MTKQAIDVARLLVQLEIPAKQRGVEWWARCPFHDERTPSWQMRDEPRAEEHGLWRCYGCGLRGNAITLVARTYGISNAEAREWLSGTGFEIETTPPLQVTVTVPTMRKLRGFALPAGVVFGPVEQWVTPARRYVLERRHMTPEQIERWGIGYAVDGYLDGRIVFPIRNGAGQIVSYTGRSYTNDPMRYKTPTDDDGADLGAIWGEERWPAIERRDLLVLTEGTINGLAIERALPFCGEILHLPAIGAACGSNLLPGHFNRLGTWKRIIAASDNDEAGDKMWRELQSLKRWVTLERAEFPPKIDADKMVRDMLATVLDRSYIAIAARTTTRKEGSPWLTA